mgnify:CR=1 FL=1
MSRIAIHGAGIIGSSWALVFARAGHEVRIFDRDQATRDALPSRLSAAASASAALHPAEPPHRVTSRIEICAHLEQALDGAMYVQESVPERLAAKQAAFGELDRLAPASALLASSTSSFCLSQFAAELAGRARCLVVHPGNGSFGNHELGVRHPGNQSSADQRPQTAGIPMKDCQHIARVSGIGLPVRSTAVQFEPHRQLASHAKERLLAEIRRFRKRTPDAFLALRRFAPIDRVHHRNRRRTTWSSRHPRCCCRN